MEESTASDALLAYLNDPTVSIVARLAQNPIDMDAESLQLSDFTECTFPGYSPVTNFDWEDVSDDPQIGEVLSANVVFFTGPLLNGQTAYAMYLTLQEGAGEPVLLDCIVFEEPILFQFPGQDFSKQVRIQTPAA